MYYYNRDSSYLSAHSRRIFFFDSVNFVDFIDEPTRFRSPARPAQFKQIVTCCAGDADARRVRFFQLFGSVLCSH